MKQKTNLAIQIISVFVQLFNFSGHLVPEEYKGMVTAFVAFLQAIVAFAAHRYNPDGTTAKIPYEPPSKTK